MKKFLSLVASAVMMFSLVAMPVHAEETALITVTDETTLVNALTTGGEIVLEDDITLTEAVVITKDIILDLNGYSIFSEVAGNTRIFNLEDGCTVFTINANNGSIESEDKTSFGIININADAVVTINGGTYDYATNNGGLFRLRSKVSTLVLNDIIVDTNCQVIGTSSGGENTIKVNGGTLNGTDVAQGHKYNFMHLASGNTATFENVTINSTYMGGIEVEGGYAELTNVTINQKGTRAAVYQSTAAAVAGNGTLIINSGIYTTEPLASTDAEKTATSHGSWTVGILNSGGTLIINDGTFSNGYYGEGTPSNPREVITVGAYDDSAVANLIINGGTFDSIGNIILTEDNGTGEISLEINGGTYNAKSLVGTNTSTEILKVNCGNFSNVNNEVGPYVNISGGATINNNIVHTSTNVEAVKPTCTEKGHTDGTECSYCEEVLSGVEDIPTKGHTLKEFKEVSATCTEDGTKAHFECETCEEAWFDEEMTKEINAESDLLIESLGHTKGELTGKKEATCTEKGHTGDKVCTVCEEVVEAGTEIPAKGHTEVKVPAVAATCEETGLTEGTKCSVCNKVLSGVEEIAAKGHKEVLEGAKEATCKEEGHTGNKVCSECDEVLEEGKVIPKTTKHTYKDGKCTVCGAEEPLNTQTGDHAPVMMFAAVAMLTMAAMVVLKKKELY